MGNLAYNVAWILGTNTGPVMGKCGDEGLGVGFGKGYTHTPTIGFCMLVLSGRSFGGS